MKKIWLFVLAFSVIIPTSQTLAADYRVEITNLTNANFFTPIITSAHRRSQNMFQLGEPASAALQAIAEGGDTSAMQAELEAGGAQVAIAETASGEPILAPGETATALVSSNAGNRRLSVAAMILPTNDAFIGLDSVNLRNIFRRTFLLYGYDAGTEANNELLNTENGGVPGTLGIPGDPSGLSGTGGSGAGAGVADINTTIHIHRGILGDTDEFGGVSDLNSAAHRWLNPVARVVVTRIRY